MNPEERINETHEAIVDICRHYLATGRMMDKALKIQMRKLDKAWEALAKEFMKEGK